MSSAILPHTRDLASLANTEHIPKFISACSKSHPEPEPKRHLVEVAASCNLWPCAGLNVAPRIFSLIHIIKPKLKKSLYMLVVAYSLPNNSTVLPFCTQKGRSESTFSCARVRDPLCALCTSCLPTSWCIHQHYQLLALLLGEAASLSV